MKTILCYGDSNTWGYDPGTRSRYPPDVRWTGVLAEMLGRAYRVVEEGLNGRTTRWDDPFGPGRSGQTYLRPCIESHEPLDLIVVMLGTNDLKRRFNLTSSDIAESTAGLAEEASRIARTAGGEQANVLLVAPPATTTLTEFDQMFAGALEKSRQFSHYYRLAAGWRRVPFFDAGSVIVSSEKDGIHFDADEHRKLAEALAGEVRRLIG
ncbi:MAG: SGNH/GDSL hydrolase family protein [Chloroflexi bacterium]|nr:SGNH/GDSL hydrolase family protein [Chloroflexota bacterium]